MQQSFHKIYDRYNTLMYGQKTLNDTAAAKTWSKPYRHYLRKWLPKQKDASIVDLACGRGYLIWFLDSLGYSNVSGVDISEEQIAAAKKVTTKVLQSDLLEFLKGQENAFDFITAIDIAEHLTKEELLLFLELTHKALKSKGRIVIQTINAESPWGMSIRYGDFTHENAFTPDVLSKILTMIGFKNIEVREAGPVVYGPKSLIRKMAWLMIRWALTAYNLIERGDCGSRIFTRVFFVSAVKEER
jgi:cyclopropane fatty-acyl-phospholipid synthase-like methyltransferase